MTDKGESMSTDTSKLEGIARVVLVGPDGKIKSDQTIKNLITDAGDLYYATRAVSAVAPNAPADATKVTGMKLGTGTTGAGKTAVGAASLAAAADYISGSNILFDAGYAKTINLGAGLGVEAQYQVTWPAGTATNVAIASAVIVNDAGTNATTTVANTISRITFTAIDKQANDILIILWKHKFLGQ